LYTPGRQLDNDVLSTVVGLTVMSTEHPHAAAAAAAVSRAEVCALRIGLLTDCDPLPIYRLSLNK